MPKKCSVKPLVQGSLDGLCGLYAIVNAAKYLFPKDNIDLERLFHFLIYKNNLDARRIDHAVEEMKNFLHEPNASLYQILCKLFNFRIPSQIYLKQASSF